MAWLKVYEWERSKWPEFQAVLVERKRQCALVTKLARHFRVDRPLIKQSHKRGAGAVAGFGAAGSYHKSSYWPTIKLGQVTTLGTLVHEFAHHLAWRRWKETGHGRAFKRELKRTYTWAKRWLPKAA